MAPNYKHLFDIPLRTELSSFDLFRLKKLDSNVVHVDLLGC